MRKRGDLDGDGNSPFSSLIEGLDNPDGPGTIDGDAIGGDPAKIASTINDASVAPEEDDTVNRVEGAADQIAATEAGDGPTVGKTAAETLSDEVFSALLDVRQTDNTKTASISTAEAQARYHSTETE